MEHLIFCPYYRNLAFDILNKNNNKRRNYAV
jgi:hypothetical protein